MLCLMAPAVQRILRLGISGRIEYGDEAVSAPEAQKRMFAFGFELGFLSWLHLASTFA
jgi:hypothetical protein